jgi:tetratricopeptide (TPR) repeat protein/predicted Ser/Thr protein kinase
MSSSPGCPPPQVLDDFACGRLSATARAPVEAHLDACPECCRVVSELALMASGAVEVPSEATTLPGDERLTGPGRAPAPTLERGTSLGRYRIEQRVGAGGMGVVYAAIDPDLNRRVALKLLHGFAMAGQDERRQRLLREAQAMAQLSHPNVVAVHDVGTVGDVVFVAMEFVDGGTLGQWMGRRHRVAEVLDVFIAAARGLAAAHAVGLVHRDFKPDNVLIGRDHRVRVTDFGLARYSSPDLADSVTGPDAGTGDALELTRVGSVIGTPAYMSPEQHAGQPADARSDQFSLCVALWEALFGARPFPGRTLAQIALAIEDGPPTPPGGRVPARVGKALRRGLMRHPSERFATLGELIAQLESVRRRRRGTWIALGIGSVALVSASVVATRALSGPAPGTEPAAAGSAPAAVDGPAVDVCEAVAPPLDETYGETARAALRAAFVAADERLGAEAADKVTTALDAWANEWTATQREACELTHVRHERPVADLEREMQCLQRLRGELGSMLDGFAAATPKVVRTAVTTVDDMSPPARCIDPGFLDRWVAPPRDPIAAAEVERIHAQLLRARALVSAGSFEEAHEVVEVALADAKKTDHPPIVAEAYYRLGAVLDTLGKYEASRDAYVEAVWTARTARHGSVELWGATALVSVVGHDLGQPEEAERWARHAIAQAERLGDEGRDALAEVHSSLGSLAFTRGEFAVSRDHHREALALREYIHGKHTYATATSLHNLAGALLELGQLDEALALRQTAVEVAEAALGPTHPDLASYVKGLGNVYLERGDPRTALPMFERAYEIRHAALGDGHPAVASALADVAVVRASNGDREAALVDHQRALAMRRTALGDHHLDVARSLASISGLYQDMGRYDEALQAGEQALQIRRERLGDAHPAVADALDRLGNVAHAQGRHAEAAAYYRRSLEIRETSLGPGNPDLVLSLSNLANSERRSGDLDDALAHLERARSIAVEVYGEAGHARLATVLENIGVIYGLQGRLDDALAIDTQSLQMRETLLGVDHPAVGRSLRAIALVHAHRGEHDEASARLERALTIFDAKGDEPFITAETRFHLARALRPSDPERARRLALTARGEFAALPEGAGDEMLAEIDAWLASE